MTTTYCQTCTAPTTNGLALCSDCQQTFTVACINIAAYFADVERIQPGQRVKTRSAYRSAPPPGTEPSRDPIAEALDHVSTVVFGWCRSLEDDRQVTMPSTTGTRLGWLESHVVSVATLPWASESLRELLGCERMLRKILDKADTGWYAGVCGNEVGREYLEDEVVPLYCERHLYGTTGSSWVVCPECGRTWDANQRREQMIRAARDEHAPVSVIASAVVGLLDGEHSVARLANRIDQWVKREKLQSLGVRVLADGKPHRVYRLGDVFDLLDVPNDDTTESATRDAEAC